MGLRFFFPTFFIVCTICLFCFGNDPDVQVEWLDSNGDVLNRLKDSLTFSRPKDPRALAYEDQARFRLGLTGFPWRPSVRMSLVSIDPRTGAQRDRLEVGSIEPTASKYRLSPWFVLVSDWQDRRSIRLAGRALVARPGDLVEARIRVGGARSDIWTMPVGRPKNENGPTSIKNISLRFVVLRQFSGGLPLVEGESGGVGSVIDHQVEILNEVLAQCFIEAIVPEHGAVLLEDPPGPCLIAIGEKMGLPSMGGEIRLQVDGKQLGPWKVGKGYTPSETARLVSHNLNSAGYVTSVSINKKLPSFAFETADILVKRTDGTLAEVGPWPGKPLSSDPMQSVDIGSVKLTDGIDSYDDTSAASGTLEERTLIKSLEDGNEHTIDVFIINHFERAQKQGESFIRASGSSLKNAALINLDALIRARHSYTLPHEVGHILLDELGHPDARGNPRTDLLMHSSSSSAQDGPKRISEKECSRMRKVSAYMFR